LALCRNILWHVKESFESIDKGTF